MKLLQSKRFLTFVNNPFRNITTALISIKIYKFCQSFKFRFAREKMKERRPKRTAQEAKKEAEEKDSYQPFEEPGWAAKPLGQWKTVETT